jgi:hypothetical protein
VGNEAFADYIDANLDVTHINNKSAPFPFLAFDILIIWHTVEKISFPLFPVQLFLCYVLTDILIASVSRSALGLPSPIW